MNENNSMVLGHIVHGQKRCNISAFHSCVFPKFCSLIFLCVLTRRHWAQPNRVFEEKLDSHLPFLQSSSLRQRNQWLCCQCGKILRRCSAVSEISSGLPVRMQSPYSQSPKFPWATQKSACQLPPCDSDIDYKPLEILRQKKSNLEGEKSLSQSTSKKVIPASGWLVLSWGILQGISQAFSE